MNRKPHTHRAERFSGTSLVRRNSCTLLLCCLVAVMTGSALAAPAGIDSITTSPASPDHNPNRDYLELTSVTVGSTTYTGLVGATVSGAAAEAPANLVFVATDETFHTDGNVAMSGLELGAAQANGARNADPIFQFGRVISETDVMFFFEIGGSDTANLQLVDEDGAAYYVVVADNDGDPSVAQVKAGQDSGGSAALKSGTITLTANTESNAVVGGLSASTAYDVYLVARDDFNNDQASVTKVDVTTDEALTGPVPADADAHVRNGGSNGNNNFGSATTMQIKRQDGHDGNNRKVYIRFDLTSLAFDHTDISDASLALNFVDTSLGVGGTTIDWTFGVWGLNDGDAGENWGEGTITWNNAPQNDTAASPGHLLLSGATKLGTFNFTGRASSVSFSDPDLTSFIAADTDDLVTLVITRDTDEPDAGNTYVHGIASKEHATVTGPELTLAEVLPGGTLFIFR